ncbi:MAG: SGNH/GDSL hydrolase family protein [Gammaproteobacteria bacterium]|nr:SGNH/GDSL hydrolase family protein [Gammaproteobacteria bacterium]
MRFHFLNRIGFWLFLPIAALQGLRLRRTATRLPEAAGEKSGACGQGEAIHLLAMGDSIIAGVGTGTMDRSLPVQFAHALAEGQSHQVQWHVDGRNGADIAHLRRQVSRLAQNQKADVILISIGVNDVTGLSSTRYWRSQVETLVMELKQAWPQARVMFAGLPPMGKFPLPPQPLRFTLGMRAATLDAIAAEVLSQESQMLHIPTEIDPAEQEFCEDGFHPSAASCAHWAQELASFLAYDRTVSTR